MIGTPYSQTATKIMLLGSGELGKEFAIEAQRLGIEVIAVDRYEHAPAMQVAHRSHVINMLDGAALEALIRQENPDFIVPEIEAIATDTLIKLEREGFQVVPNARAAKLTMDREGIRRLAAETLQLKTSRYFFADDFSAFETAVQQLGFPCVVKPLMSSSGKGQSVIRNAEKIKIAWEYSQQGGRSGAGRVIIEQFIPLDYEITLLTVRHKTGTIFCEPIGHRQEDGDYRESWQPHPMSESILKKCRHIAKTITDELGGFGLFGVELMIHGDTVYFSEVSPRPHDTGLVTLLSQDLSEFALHLRAISGLPIPEIKQYGPTASSAILFSGKSTSMTFNNLESALHSPGTALRLFGKPEVNGKRRLGVALARGETIAEAIEKAKAVTDTITINDGIDGNDAIELVAYDPLWPEMAEIEIKKLHEIFHSPDIIDIQHVGSTAIPGLIAKPIIDIQMAVNSLNSIKQIAIDKLKISGYEYWHENPDPERMFFVKGMPPFGEKRTHHVHIVEPSSRHWQGKIIFRDYLITHPEAAREYAELKQKLAERYKYDRERYTDAKERFIHEILKKSKIAK